MEQATLVDIPIKHLVQSSRNVRKSKPSKEADQELLAGIRTEGLLQNLVVIQNGKPGMFEVTAGKRRLKALQQLVKEGHLKDTDTVPCRFYEDASNAEKISLIENTQRLRMHPADEFEACRKMQRNGMGIDDIAAALGMPESTVRKRLKLSQVASEIIKAYRNDEITLEAVMAFTVEDDRARQIEVFNTLIEDGHQINAWQIRSALRGETERSGGRLAKFVGEKAYIKAGGTLSHDLFQEVSYFNDRDILVEQAIAKLERASKKIADDWNWIEITIDPADPHAMKRVQAHPGPDTAALQAQLDDTTQKADQLEEMGRDLEDDEWEEKHAAQYQRLQDHAEKLEAEIESTLVYDPAEQALAGCIVTISSSGKLQLIEGLVRKSDEKALRELQAPGPSPQTGVTNAGDSSPGEPAASDEDDATLSQALKEDMTTYRLNIAKRFIAAGGEIEARDLLYYTLCMETFTAHYYGSPLSIRISETRPPSSLTKPDTGRAVTELAETKASLNLGWIDIDDAAERFDAFTQLESFEKTNLMAFCVAQMLSGSMANTNAYPEVELTLKSLDIPWHKYFQPTSDNYLGRVSKAHLLALGGQFFTELQREGAEKRSKKEIAKELEEIFAGKDATLSPDKRSEAIDWVPSGFKPL
tara:strand:+ start:19466 stop:21394 length:1929 start_codon:yes stop_codon:yes gene_type:complete